MYLELKGLIIYLRRTGRFHHFTKTILKVWLKMQKILHNQMANNEVFISFLLLINLSNSCNNKPVSFVQKEFSDKILDVVLSENKIDQEYCFEVTQKSGTLKYCIVNIGKLKGNDGDIVFLLNTVLSGTNSPSANSYIYLFSQSGIKLGYYYVGCALNILPKLRNDSLVFQYDDSECNQTTSIGFKDSIPKTIFIRCKEDSINVSGDEYEFVAGNVSK